MPSFLYQSENPDQAQTELLVVIVQLLRPSLKSHLDLHLWPWAAVLGVTMTMVEVRPVCGTGQHGALSQVCQSKRDHRVWGVWKRFEETLLSNWYKWTSVRNPQRQNWSSNWTGISLTQTPPKLFSLDIQLLYDDFHEEIWLMWKAPTLCSLTSNTRI